MTRLSMSGRCLVAWGIALALLSGSPLAARGQAPAKPKVDARTLFARDNLVAWCIVPFDSKKRGPEDRAAMLKTLGFKHFAYDWRGEHIPTFDAEVEALKKAGVGLDAWWVAPGELNKESRLILDVLKRHQVKAQLWVLLDFGPNKVAGAEQKKRVDAAVAKLSPLAAAAKEAGCTLALYNHGGWFGEPENQIEIIEALRTKGIDNVGLVYNLHHGHDHLDRFPALLQKMKPYLLTLSLNGMDPAGDKVGRKILPLGQGSLDLDLLRTIVESGYTGPIGILGHTQDDAEERLRDNLDGLDWLVPQLEGKPAGPKPKPRTPVPGMPPAKAASAVEYRPELVAELVREATEKGDARRGAMVFASTQFACISCHQVGKQGGKVGPDLTAVGNCQPAEYLAESLLWPKRQVNLAFSASAVATTTGKVVQGYKQEDRADHIVIRDGTTDQMIKIPKSEIEEVKEIGTLMPEGLAASMTPEQRRDVVRFLMELGKSKGTGVEAYLAHAHAASSFPFDAKPRRPELWPNASHPINRDRLYEYYSKEAEYFVKQDVIPSVVPAYPGIDGGKYGHWGNQNEETWADARWNDTDLGVVLSGIFRGNGKTVPKGVCVRLGEKGEAAACFNPETLQYEVVWTGGFVKFSRVRHGFMDGLIMDGKPLPQARPGILEPFVYHGFHRVGNRVVFAYRIGDKEYLDSPDFKDGKFVREFSLASEHPLRDKLKGGSLRWPQVFKTKGTLGNGRPYAVDTIPPPFDNPWKAPMFFGDNDFLADGTALLCTMQGDVWRVEGIDSELKDVRWRRVASGIQQPQGLVVAGDAVYVLGRDQITRLHDYNNDGEYDFHECVNNTYPTSPAGHDFVCGLQRDGSGNFYTAAGHLGLIKIPGDGRKYEVVATGFRNPDGLGLSPDGILTVPCSEGEWTPASMICEIKPGGFYGYKGPIGGKAPELPLVYLPRGLDNSSGAQTTVTSDRWGPLKGNMVHFSFGTGTHFLLLRDVVDGRSQGAVVPLAGDFLSGIHRGRFSPKDGQLYVSGMGGWGSYTTTDGCFQRVRYTGERVQLPTSFHVHENGVVLKFSEPVDPSVAASPRKHFAQAWNYRYSFAYGSPELSPSHPGQSGHDVWPIASAHVLADGRSLFLEIPDIQPVNVLHIQTRPDSGEAVDLFATVHKLAPAFTDFSGYRPVKKVIAAHPMDRDMAMMTKTLPNPYKSRFDETKGITIEAGANLTYTVKSFKVKAGETVRLNFRNPDVVPHNWVLVKQGALERVGNLANLIIADPDAALRHYVPKTDDVLAYTDIVFPQDTFGISFRAPKEKGRYPYLCTFPGHWMVMNGVMIVE